MAENLHVTRSRLLNRNRNRLLMLPNFDILFQLVPLPEIRVTDQISSTLNFKNGGPRLQGIVLNKIQNCKYLACREKQPSSLDLNKAITVSVFS